MAADAAPSFVYLPELASGGETIEVAGDEAHYLSRVVRVRVGEQVSATDGAGGLATLEVLETGTRLRALEVVEHADHVEQHVVLRARDRLLALALRAAAEVLQFGLAAQPAVLVVDVLAAAGSGRGGIGGGIARRLALDRCERFGSAFARVAGGGVRDILGHALGVPFAAVFRG